MIRPAIPDDIPRLVAMGERFLTETVYAGRVAVNPEAMARTVALLIESPVGVVFVAERDELVVGMIGLLLFEHPITGEVTASELFWWVDPEHRGYGGLGLRLLKRGERWALTSGAKQVHMIAPTTEIGGLYQKLGYVFLESAYHKALA